MRVDRALANLGYGSRVEVARLVRAGAVRHGGEVVRDVAAKVDPTRLTLEGAPLDHPGGVLVALHKPVGVVCSHDRNEGPTVYDLLPARWSARNPRVESVGRLDRDSSGLLLLTDDHQLLHRLTAPSHHVAKRYVVRLAEVPSDPAGITAEFGSGRLRLSGERAPCRPAPVQWLAADRAEVVLTEGRNRQVRRMFAAVGAEVVELHRVAVGPYALDDLAAGEWRDVAPELSAG